MSGYNELIKNFENIRSFMREFYVYGFKSREEYDKKSARSYDNERRRMESWLGEHMSFVRSPEGKNVFISIDSRVSTHNPLYKALKSKSFTDKDITLHFILFDILYSPEDSFSLQEILEKLDGYLSDFSAPMVFDESTVRKKLKEYTELGVIISEKEGKRVTYRRSEDTDISGLRDVLDFFSEAAPSGVIGSFLLDKLESTEDIFFFKHHYITSAIDSDVLTFLFIAMREKRMVTVKNLSRKQDEARENLIVPLRVFISVQSGRQHLLAYQPDFNIIKSFRIDYLSDVKIGEVTPRFSELRSELDGMQQFMWGVTAKRKNKTPEHVEFTIKAEDNEDHILRRLQREKRVGKVEILDKNTYRFSADVYDSGEMIPWIRTFICRITDISFSDKAAEKRFRNDIKEMYRMYDIGEGEE